MKTEMGKDENHLVMLLLTTFEEKLAYLDAKIDRAHGEIYLPISNESEFRVWPQVLANSHDASASYLTVQVGVRFPKVEAILESLCEFQKRPFSWTLGCVLSDIDSSIPKEGWAVLNLPASKNVINDAVLSVVKCAYPVLKHFSTLDELVNHIEGKKPPYLFERELRIPVIYALKRR